MADSILKRYLPRGLYGRAALILIVPIITIQLVVSVVFLQRHFEDVTRQMTGTVVRDLMLVRSDPDLAGILQIEVTEEAPPIRDRRVFYDFSGRVVTQELRRAFPDIAGVDLASNDKEVRVAMPGFDTALVLSRRRVSASNPHQFLVLTLFISLVMTLVGFLFLRNQVRPIRRLASVAEAFGRGQNLPYQPSGASEVRAAGAAFLDMRQRIERHIDQRTLLLSGVSHDLRTPLTRMRLELSMMDSAEAEGLQRDVQEMQRMIDAFLDFARENAGEAPVMVDPVALARAQIEDFARMGHRIEARLPGQADEIALRPIGVARALENLLKNAFRHGTTVRLSLEITRAVLRIVVEDDGPGIPAHQREEAMRPFARLDAARDASGSVGLGLAIVTDVVRAHGGQLRLDDSPDLGGLRAAMVLPR